MEFKIPKAECEVLAAPSSARVRYRTTPLFLRQRRLSVAEEGPTGEPCARDVYVDAGAVPCSSPQARIPARASPTLPPAVGAPLALSPLANDYAIKPFPTALGRLAPSTSLLLESLSQILPNDFPVNKTVPVHWNLEGT